MDPQAIQIERRNWGAVIEPVWLGAQDTRPEMKIREWRELVSVFFPGRSQLALVRVLGNQNAGWTWRR
jgi:hypothetical protein